jgi:hypothetical protein
MEAKEICPMNTHRTVLALIALTSTALANGKVDPKLPKEIQPMYCLVGTWTSQNGTAVIEGKKHKVDLHITCAPTSQGMAIACTDTFDIEGMGRVEENDLFGYDPGQNRYHWFAVTGRGETHDHVALPPTEKGAVTFSYSGYEGGKPMQEVVTMTFNDDGSKIDFKNDGIVAGQPAWKLAATMIKSK